MAKYTLIRPIASLVAGRNICYKTLLLESNSQVEHLYDLETSVLLAPAKLIAYGSSIEIKSQTDFALITPNLTLISLMNRLNTSLITRINNFHRKNLNYQDKY